MPITDDILRGIIYSLENGLTQLETLQFEHYASARQIVLKLIRVCNSRTDRGLKSVSIHATEVGNIFCG